MPKLSAFSLVSLPAGIGAFARAPHHRVDIGVIPHVECAGRSGADGYGEERGEADDRIDMRRRYQNAG